MKFALFTHVPWPEGEAPARLFAECIEQAVFAEELGFHSAWIAEHHFSRYSLGSSSLVLASAISARTERIRLGTGRAHTHAAQSDTACGGTPPRWTA